MDFAGGTGAREKPAYAFPEFASLRRFIFVFSAVHGSRKFQDDSDD
jgi:hypothetical protein